MPFGGLPPVVYRIAYRVKVIPNALGLEAATRLLRVAFGLYFEFGFYFFDFLNCEVEVFF